LRPDAQLYDLHALKAWLDQVVRFGKTFSYGESGPKGLLSGKKAYVLTSRGAPILPHAICTIRFSRTVLAHILGFIGLTDVTFIHAKIRPNRICVAAKAAAIKGSNLP